MQLSTGERENIPNETQVALAHSAIDNGADLVLGHHPHVLQGIEEYKGKNIVYSLGNFCFGGNSAPSDMDTMIFQQTFTIEDGELQKDNVTNIIPCKISSAYAEGYNNYQPTPMEGAEGEAIFARIKEYSQAVGTVRAIRKRRKILLQRTNRIRNIFISWYKSNFGRFYAGYTLGRNASYRNFVRCAYRKYE